MTAAPTITISIVCSPEQLAHVQARVSALEANLCRPGVAFSVISQTRATGLDALMASPCQSNADSDGDTVYDRFVGGGMTPAVAVRLVPQQPPAAA